MNSHEAKLKFLLHVTKHGLQSFDSGGTVLSGPGSSVQMPTQGNTGVTGLAGGLGLTNQANLGAANIQPGTNAAQLNASYGDVQQGLANQRGLANTLIPQASGAVNNQGLLASQLVNQIQGNGPSVAQNQLNQATGQNIANQAALMASARGASNNPALIARQAAEQGANISQNAAGQAATLRAQEQIAAQNNLANLSANQIAQSGQAANNLTSAQQAEQNILQYANAANNNANVSMQNNLNSNAAQIGAANQGVAGGLLGGILSGGSSVLGGLGKVFGLAEGGEVPSDDSSTKVLKENYHESPKHGYMKLFADGGNVIMGNPISGGIAPAQSFAGNWLVTPNYGGQIDNTPISNLGNADTGKDLQKSISDSGSSLGKAIKGKPDEFEQFKDVDPTLQAEGGTINSRKHLAAKGGKVKANSAKEKAEVKDNSYKNDKIPALLSEGEIVLPRTVTKHPNAPEMAAEFVRRTIAKKGLRK